MSNPQFQNEVLVEFVEQLGTLLSIRINQYIRKYHGGSESIFFNQFVVCPDDDSRSDNKLLKYPAASRNHFVENLNLRFTNIELSNIALTNDKKIQYSLTCYPEFIVDEYDGDYLEMTLVENKLTIEGQIMINILENSSHVTFKSLVKKIQQEISFETLKMV